MFSALLKNTIVSAVAYGGVAALNLLLVPVLVAAYGLDTYGLIVLARVFLPSGFAIADFGLSETGTIVVARARATGSWDSASPQLSLLLALSIVIALVMGILLLFSSTLLPAWLNVPDAHRDSFARLIWITALSLLVFYPALLLEGMVKGYERYTLLRTLEVGATLAYVVGALILVRAGDSYISVAYVFLATAGTKYIVLTVCALPTFRQISWRFDWSNVEARAEVRRRSTLMVQNKLLGVLQMQLPPLAIGLIVGPAGVGTYDVLTRVPRAMKSVLSLLTAALLPLSARLDEGGDYTRMRALGTAGFSIVPVVAFPALIGAAVFAPELLHVWLGPGLVHLWPWLALMFVVPALNALLNFGQTLMQVRADFLSRSNRLTAVQIAGQYVISLALVPWLRERAFIAGQVAAQFAAFPWHLALQLREQGIRFLTVGRLLAKHGILALALASSAAVLKRSVTIDGAAPLLAWYVVWCGIYWLGWYVLTLSRPERVYVHRVLRAAIGSATQG